MTYSEYLDGQPVIVTVATTGGVHGKEAHPDLPETPDEIADATAESVDAGASIVHVHAREANGERSYERERFQAIDDAIRERSGDVVIQHTTGGTAVPTDLRAESLRTDPPPEMASLDMGPLNRYAHLTSENTRATIDALAAEMADRGIKPEMEAFNGGHLNEVGRLVEEGIVEEPYYVNLIFGPGTLTIPHPRNFLNLVENLPERAIFNILATGRHQLPFAALAIVLGGHVRVGLEDNLYYRQGELATNAQLVERVVDLAETLGRPVATPDEAREILGLD
jgi:3-keto-5-aminohexanoate cleavage enzyme